MIQMARRLPGWWRVRSLLLPHAAALNRKRLEGVTFVGITGSAGKTTAKNLARAVLSTTARTRSSPATANTFESVMSTVFATKSSDDFCVIEFSADPRGSLDPSLALDRSLATVRPKIGVVTSIGTDHLKKYHSVEAIAEAKSKVIRCLPADGVAVLNADDPLVIAMADRSPCRVITYGASETAMLRARNIRSAWPERLTFTVVYQNQSAEVRSQLCGSHWISAILAALGVGIAAGIPLEKAARAVESVEPYPGRMYPLAGKDGTTFIVDDWKSGLWTMPSVFEFLKAAHGERKVLIVGTLSDYGGSAARTYTRTAVSALEVADQVIFVGPMASHALRAKGPENADRIHAFGTIKSAADFLASLLQRGDLVVLKGAGKADHLGRLAHNWIEPISCWSMACRKNTPCSGCHDLRAKPQAIARRQDAGLTAATGRVSKTPAELPALIAPLEVVVGIGNPGNRYRNTPHNVGFEVTDALAEKLDLEWTVYGDVALAHAKLNGKTVLLLKPQTYVNNLGKSLKELSEAVGFTADDCILIQDDISLPLGKLRSRARGSDGGHKGVRAALTAFQTNEFRRLKIGVAPAQEPHAMAEYLVKPLSAEAVAILEPAIKAAADRILSELEKPRSGGKSLQQMKASA
jgi:UDP-N-acetylmuramoyl-tripeptide--D-alanyl-D-alanine ligase